MSVTTKKSVYYELAGVPVTGLTPTCTVKDLRSGSVIIRDKVMTEDPDLEGFYAIQVSGHENHEFILKADAGSDSVDNRKQAYDFVLLAEQPHRGSFQMQSTSERKLSKDQIKSITDLLKIEIPEIKVDQKYLNSSLAIENRIKKLEKLEAMEKRIETRLDSFVNTLDEDITLSKAQIRSISNDLIENIERQDLSLKNSLEEVLELLTKSNNDLGQTREGFDGKIKDLHLVTLDDVSDFKTEYVSELKKVFTDLQGMRKQRFETGGQDMFSQDDINELEKELEAEFTKLFDTFIKFKRNA